ncbi:MAG: radical SAM/CxCxxxxC motif protein YfkAB [Alicyclobacillaceae bacterium]|nr:radical SAM/CxCxxxxC motif protein YfkAB [Alicyclobacillaceae bacterium]
MTVSGSRKAISAAFDPWDPLLSRDDSGDTRLTSIEVTVTHQCNLRCEHCAVGEWLTRRESRQNLEELLARLDEIEDLTTLSITGGEPSYRDDVVDDVVVPLLRYAKGRGCYTQVNTNLTLEIDRYRRMAPYVDVLHITHNYTGPRDFGDIVFGKMERRPGSETAERLFRRLEENTRALAAEGVFVSAESMMSPRTRGKLAAIHRRLAEMGVRRHEIHPLYPCDFAKDLNLLSLDELRAEIHALLDGRDPGVWILFGTLPFYACSEDPRDRELLARIFRTPNTTVRNDPDGRNRLNVNLLTGGIYVQDFADLGPIGDWRREPIRAAFQRWQREWWSSRLNCCCPHARCLGPNLIVADTYYRGVDFSARRASEEWSAV